MVMSPPVIFDSTAPPFLFNKFLPTFFADFKLNPKSADLLPVLNASLRSTTPAKDGISKPWNVPSADTLFDLRIFLTKLQAGFRHVSKFRDPFTCTPPVAALETVTIALNTPTSNVTTCAVGLSDGLSELNSERLVGESVGEGLGDRVGPAEGTSVGATLGKNDGTSDGPGDGAALGTALGAALGATDGLGEGMAEEFVGKIVGKIVGTADGRALDSTAGARLGARLGATNFTASSHTASAPYVPAFLETVIVLPAVPPHS